MTTRVGVVVFPGSNCEQDVCEAVRQQGVQAELLWHGDSSLQQCDAIVIPGGFAYGDYLRPGAIARFSPVMGAVSQFAREGGPVVGICNGFQILTEAGLLPGALQKNRGLKFLCSEAQLRVESTNSVLTQQLDLGAVVSIPINHFEGNFTCDAQTLQQLQQEDRIVFRYVNNPNGRIDDIAGVCNEGRNVVGLMPHPERAISDLLGSIDGIAMFRALVSSVMAG